jgi:vancomycin permeability regulator SanA
MIVKAIKWSALLSFTVMLTLALYFTHVYREIRNTAEQDEAQPADVIIVLGAAQYNGRPSPVFKARLDHALKLYSNGLAHAVITTGSYGADPNFSEAEVGKKYLVEHGVAVNDIMTEQGGGSTSDSVQAAAGLLKARGWKTALVVSDGFHLYRARQMFIDHGVVAYTSPAPDSPIEVAASQRFWHTVREVVLVAVYKWIAV